MGSAQSEPPAAEDNRDYWVNHLGATLRARRSGRFTVEELSARSGVSAGLISQIERGIGNPSFATLLRLANALEVPMADMFLGQQSHETKVLVRREERLRMELPGDGIVQEMLVPNTDRKLGVLEMTIPSGFRGEDVPHSHPGEEVVVVLSGTLRATIGGQAFVLNEGDTMSYDSSTPHWWSNEHEEPAVILAISTPPSLGRVH
ncbi:MULTISPECIES: helix-turn-helix domain-containing protein [Amycolatopsis]|uniref:helix-turn-helix domain-containing protein n=1 Tax=Amycolatopsis sp. cg13 TaxID=3238807 RepID=UPI0035246790